jgi:hypothetical protein
LEPGNLHRASRAGHTLEAGHEVLRLVVAAALGARATPFMFWLMRRYPLIENAGGGFRWRHVGLQLVGMLAAALALILVSCVLAAWCFMHKGVPSADEIRGELISNGLLLVFALCVFQMLAYLKYLARLPVRAPAPPAAGPPVPGTRFLTRVAVKTRGRLSYVDLADVEWIETQGNYLALHTGTATHLIRETAARFETQLDPAHFVRIHRRILLAVDRLRDMRPEGNGDATVRLHSGQELRVSRRYREGLKQRMAAGA